MRHPRTMTGHPLCRSAVLLTVAALAGSIVAGCDTSSAATRPHPDGSATRSAAGGMAMSPGMTMPRPRMGAASGTVDRPTQTARMVCSQEIHGDVQKTFALPSLGPATPSWKHRRYTCTYHLPGGPLVLAVQDSPTITTGDNYFRDQRRRDGNPPLLNGLAALGLPSYQTSSGVVAFIKDGKTLRVDATHLQPPPGPHEQSRSQLAYAVAADVIGCWSE